MEESIFAEKADEKRAEEMESLLAIEEQHEKMAKQLIELEKTKSQLKRAATELKISKSKN